MTLVVFVIPGETESIVEFPGWRDPAFVGLYICTSFMGERERGVGGEEREADRSLAAPGTDLRSTPTASVGDRFCASIPSIAQVTCPFLVCNVKRVTRFCGSESHGIGATDRLTNRETPARRRAKSQGPS